VKLRIIVKVSIFYNSDGKISAVECSREDIIDSDKEGEDDTRESWSFTAIM
jgi:hypothetical protein